MLRREISFPFKSLYDQNFILGSLPQFIAQLVTHPDFTKPSLHFFAWLDQNATVGGMSCRRKNVSLEGQSNLGRPNGHDSCGSDYRKPKAIALCFTAMSWPISKKTEPGCPWLAYHLNLFTRTTKLKNHCP